MIDDESRRKDEAFARKLRDWKRRRDGDCKLFFDVFGEPEVIEQHLAARKLAGSMHDSDGFCMRRVRRATAIRPAGSV
jgi:hypothetical protein